MTLSIDDLLKRKEKELWDKLREWPYGGPHAVPNFVGQTLIANRHFIAQMAQSPPGACHGNGWGSALEIVQSDLVPKDTAYIVRKPSPIQYEPIEFIPDSQHESRMFRVWQDLTVKLGVPRHVIHDCWEADVEPKVKWPEPVVPAQPLSWWQWLVIVGVLSWILCALSRAV